MTTRCNIELPVERCLFGSLTPDIVKYLGNERQTNYTLVRAETAKEAQAVSRCRGQWRVISQRERRLCVATGGAAGVND